MKRLRLVFKCCCQLCRFDHSKSVLCLCLFPTIWRKSSQAIELNQVFIFWNKDKSAIYVFQEYMLLIHLSTRSLALDGAQIFTFCKCGDVRLSENGHSLDRPENSFFKQIRFTDPLPSWQQFGELWITRKILSAGKICCHYVKEILEGEEAYYPPELGSPCKILSNGAG